MPSITSEQSTPLGIRLALTYDGDEWWATILHEALFVLDGGAAAETFKNNKNQLLGIALAKIEIGETIDREIIVSLSDLHRTDLQVT